jgi:hypothetical protein
MEYINYEKNILKSTHAKSEHNKFGNNYKTPNPTRGSRKLEDKTQTN